MPSSLFAGVRFQDADLPHYAFERFSASSASCESSSRRSSWSHSPNVHHASPETLRSITLRNGFLPHTFVSSEVEQGHCPCVAGATVLIRMLSTSPYRKRLRCASLGDAVPRTRFRFRVKIRSCVRSQSRQRGSVDLPLWVARRSFLRIVNNSERIYSRGGFTEGHGALHNV